MTRPPDHRLDSCRRSDILNVLKPLIRMLHKGGELIDSQSMGWWMEPADFPRRGLQGNAIHKPFCCLANPACSGCSRNPEP